MGDVISKGGKIVVGAVGPAPGTMHIEGAYSQTSGTITFNIDPNGQGGFLEGALQFTPGDSVLITDTKIVFDFLDGANPLAFSDSGAFDLDTFFTESNGSLFSNDFNLESLFASDSFTLNVPNFEVSGFGANGAVDLVPSSVPEPASLTLLGAALGLLFGTRAICPTST